MKYTFKGSERKRFWPNRGTIPVFFVKGLLKATIRLGIVGVPNQIRTKHLPNSSVERHSQSNLPRATGECVLLNNR